MHSKAIKAKWPLAACAAKASAHTLFLGAALRTVLLGTLTTNTLSFKAHKIGSTCLLRSLCDFLGQKRLDKGVANIAHESEMGGVLVRVLIHEPGVDQTKVTEAHEQLFPPYFCVELAAAAVVLGLHLVEAVDAAHHEVVLLGLLVFKCLNGQPLEYIALNVILRKTKPIYGA